MTSSGLITNDGKKIMLDRTYNTSPTRSVVNEFKVGIGTTTANLADTDLEHPVPIQQTTDQVDDCEVITGWTDSADMTISVNTTTYKEGSASLDLTKDGTSSTTTSTYKTTPSYDFTNKELSIWIYVIDATALAKLATTSCLNIRYGSDSSNYYEWNKDNADLTAGQWNLLDGLTSSNADSTTGTPTIGAMDYFYIELVATSSGDTWSAGDFAMDDIKLISSDDYTKTFESGYPALDFTTIQSEIRCRINTLQANGYPLTEFGIFNSDGTPLLESRDTYSVVSKSDTDEIIFIARTIIE